MDPFLAWETIHKAHYALRSLRDFVWFKGDPDGNLLELDICRDIKYMVQHYARGVGVEVLEQSDSKAKTSVEVYFSMLRDVLDREQKNVALW